MASNTERIIERMQSSFPQIYNVYDKKTVLYALLSVFGSKYGMRTDTIDRLYAMIGIDSTYNEDLEHRWGSLLGISKQMNESFDDYRNRLKIVYSSLNGGTAEAIKYAIASAAGIESDSETINEYIRVYDAWEYPYNIDPSLFGLEEIVDETSLYGCIVCTIDLSIVDGQLEHSKVMEAINNTKASGINPYLLFLYNTDELLKLLSQEQITNAIKYDTSDDASIDSDNSIEFNDKITIRVVEERVAISNTKSDIWSTLGTNSTVLNKSFITNMYVESDECTDRIILNN